MPHDVPQKPWHTLGSDLFFWNNLPYLLVSDYYSKFPLTRKLSDIRSDTTIAHLKSIFEEHGIPSKLITGNDTQFTSTLFQKFSNAYGFVHVTTSPYFSQANGFIKRTAQTVKGLLQKCKESGSDPHLAMLRLHSTPLDHNIPSPAELLNSRVYQTNLPAISKPRQEKQKSQYDKTSKHLPVIRPDDPLGFLYPHSHKWEPGIVKCHTETPHSYVVDMADGSIRRRNRSHIRPTGENIDLHESSDMDTDATPSVNEDSPPTSPTTCPQTVAGGADREATLR